MRTGLDVDAMGSKGDIYVKGINDLYEKDVTATSGWKYRVNGAFPNIVRCSYSKTRRYNRVGVCIKIRKAFGKGL